MKYVCYIFLIVLHAILFAFTYLFRFSCLKAKPPTLPDPDPFKDHLSISVKSTEVVFQVSGRAMCCMHYRHPMLCLELRSLEDFHGPGQRNKLPCVNLSLILETRQLGNKCWAKLGRICVCEQGEGDMGDSTSIMRELCFLSPQQKD